MNLVAGQFIEGCWWEGYWDSLQGPGGKETRPLYHQLAVTLYMLGAAHVFCILKAPSLYDIPFL